MKKILSFIGACILIYGIYLAFDGSFEAAATGIADILLTIIEVGGSLVASLIEALRGFLSK